jgi:predicted lipoprotein with Yx(FWY)xxD motif
MRRLSILAAALLVAGLAAFAAANASAATHVKLHRTSLGRFLTDGKGHTLYMFGADSRNTSNCSGTCSTYWPPLTTHARPKAGHGVQRSHLRTIKRSDGTRQVTYHGHPLYRYFGDQRKGDTFGEGMNAFGGLWYVVSRGGHAILPASPY